jgi:hypothetical protein
MGVQKKIILSCFILFAISIQAQQISGYWKGKIGTIIGGIKVELKLVLKGDSIVGTSYYYTSKNSFTRYSIKGYFEPKTNAVIWWDDKLIESKKSTLASLINNQSGFYNEADFNCPGGGVMMLDGKASDKGKQSITKLKMHLDKTDKPIFNDEWNIVIDNWLVGGNSISLIDSIQNVAFNKPVNETSKPLEEVLIAKQEVKIIPEVVLDLPIKRENASLENIGIKPITKENKEIEFLDLSKPNKKEIAKPDSTNSHQDQLELKEGFGRTDVDHIGVTINNFSIDSTKKIVPPIVFEQIEKPKKKIDTILNTSGSIITKFVERQKVILSEMPYADTMELHFYDNAEVDGDSISLFLNNTLLLKHIKLTDKPYIIKLGKEQLQGITGMTMVAENLGSIPPNTSYMVAFINGKKYTATLSSTEKTSAVIRFKKE